MKHPAGAEKLFKFLKAIICLVRNVKTDFESLGEDDIIKNLGLKDVFVVKRSVGIIIMKKDFTLTDMLSNLIETSEKSKREWKESEYGEYLTSRSG